MHTHLTAKSTDHDLQFMNTRFKARPPVNAYTFNGKIDLSPPPIYAYTFNGKID